MRAFLSEWATLWLLAGLAATIGNVMLTPKSKAVQVGFLIYVMSVLLGPLTLLMFLVDVLTRRESKGKTCPKCRAAITKAEARHCPHCGAPMPG
jgi:hypothetical protein